MTRILADYTKTALYSNLKIREISAHQRFVKFEPISVISAYKN